MISSLEFAQPDVQCKSSPQVAFSMYVLLLSLLFFIVSLEKFPRPFLASPSISFKSHDRTCKHLILAGNAYHSRARVVRRKTMRYYSAIKISLSERGEKTTLEFVLSRPPRRDRRFYFFNYPPLGIHNNALTVNSAFVALLAAAYINSLSSTPFL